MADQPFLASNSFNGDGVTTVWEFSFEGLAVDAPLASKPYIDSADVRAELIVGEGDTQITTPQAFLFETANSLRIEPAVPTGTVLRIYRATENRFPLVNYQDLQSVGASDLDLANRQAVYIVQEARDAARGAGNVSAETLALSQGAATAAAASAALAVAQGILVLGDYAAGLTFTTRNQAFRYQEDLYLPSAGLPLPYTTDGSGAPEIEMFRSVGDATLRADLANGSDLAKGAGLIGRSAQVISAISDLRIISANSPSKTALVLGHFYKGDGGGGVFVWDSSDLSLQVSADVNSGLYVAPESQDGSSGAWVRTEGSAIVDCTVLIPATYPTIQLAIDSMCGIKSTGGARIFLKIQTGHQLPSGTSLFFGDYAHFVISSEDPTVSLSSAFPNNSAVVYGESCNMPKLGCVIDGGGLYGLNGYVAAGGSIGEVLSGCGITNLGKHPGSASSFASGKWGTDLWGAGMCAVGNSLLVAKGAVSTGNRRNVWVTWASKCTAAGGLFSGSVGTVSEDGANVYVSRASEIQVDTADMSGATYKGLFVNRSRCSADQCNVSGSGIGLFGVHGSTIAAAFLNANNCGTNAVYLSRGVTADIHQLQGKAAGNTAILMSMGCTADARLSDISGSASEGIIINGSCTLNFEQGNCSGAALYGMTAIANSNINAVSASARIGVSDSTSDIRIIRGSFISAHSSIGGISSAANTLTINGAIFK